MTRVKLKVAMVHVKASTHRLTDIIEKNRLGLIYKTHWPNSRKENLQCILVTSWLPQHKWDERCGIAEGRKCEDRELEIVAKHIAHMVEKY